jgi:hypothetical protein
MRSFATSILLVFAFCSSASAAADLSGNWVIDLKASDSPDAMLKRLGIGWIQRILATSTKIEATYCISPGLLTIDTRGPAFSRTEQIRLDGQPDRKTEKLTGPYTIISKWDPTENKLVSTSTFDTKDGRPGELTVVRLLADNGATLVLTQTLKVDGEQWVVRRIWRRIVA